MADLHGILWDLDGTIAETERLHEAAFNDAFAQHGVAPIASHTEYLRLLHAAPSGGARIRRHLRETMPDLGAAPLEALAVQIHATKGDCFRARLARETLEARPGVKRLFGEAKAAGIALGLCSTAQRAGAEAVVRAT